MLQSLEMVVDIFFGTEKSEEEELIRNGNRKATNSLVHKMGCLRKMRTARPQEDNTTFPN